MAMTEALARSWEEAQDWIKEWVADRARGGPDRRSKALALARAFGERTEFIEIGFDQAEVEFAVSRLRPLVQPEEQEAQAKKIYEPTRPRVAEEAEVQSEAAEPVEPKAQAQQQPSPLRRLLGPAPKTEPGKDQSGAHQEPKKEEPPEEPKAEPKPAELMVAQAQRQLQVVPQPAAVPEAVREMNDKHAVISNLGGKCVVMEWVPSAITEGGEELGYQSFTSFKERYANRYVDLLDGGRGRFVSVPQAPLWLAHPERRQYEGLDLVPNGPAVLPGNRLNLWRGWGIEPRKGSWRLLERHIVEVLANGNQEFEDFIRLETAWKFQNPGLPTEVVLALLGGKGAGKGTWGYTLMLIFGQHGLQIFSTAHLCGKHNAHLQNKLFLFLDEAMWAGDREAERVLKGITTEKWMMIEPKGINAFQWPNRLWVLMSGNDKWIVPASHDERRYAVNKINEQWKQNKDYFRPLFEEINNGGAAAMLYDLLQLDLDGWHPRENVPQTKVLVEQKMLGLTGLQQWYVHMLSLGELPWPTSMKNPRFVLSERLIEDAAHNPRNRFTTPDELGRFMREMGCEHKSNGKKWGWVFPPLAEAREAWLRGAGGNWDWLAPEIKDWGEKPPELARPL
jgi:hypothetical protein